MEFKIKSFQLGFLFIHSVPFEISSVQLLSHVRLFATAWTAAYQASLSITNSQRLLKLMSINWWCHPTISSSLVCPLLLLPSIFPSIMVFSSDLALYSQSIAASALASVFPMNIQGWFPLGLTDLISLLSKGFSRVFSSTIQKHQLFGAQPPSWYNSHIHTWLLEKP